ncbi:MAG: hypothetical protein ACRDNZ_01190, partial [Streptosporangiaceae bacterium]
PWLADHLLATAIARRHPDFGPLAPLPDQIEAQAHAAALQLARPQGTGWRGAADAITRIVRPAQAPAITARNAEAAGKRAGDKEAAWTSR